VNFPSHGTPEFWELYRLLPQEIRQLAQKNYQIWRSEPFHPSLNFKKISQGKWSVRIGIHYRAIGQFEGKGFVWGWIGSHADYDRLA